MPPSGGGALAGGPHRRLTTPGVVRELLAGEGVRPRLGFGQHFLIDANVLRIITDAAGLEQYDTVIEVGPGLGALTQALVEQSGRVYAIETDEHLVNVLRGELSYAGNLVIINADAMAFDPETLWEGTPGAGVKMVSNLPYQIAASLLVGWLNRFEWLSEYVVMVQREVAERVLAAPGGKDYSSASVKIQYRATVERVANVSHNSFYPRPRVDSSVIRLVRRPAGESSGMPQAADVEHLYRVITAAFGQRRKKLTNSVPAGIPGLRAESVAGALDELGKGASARAEELTPPEFVKLANALG
jgi:16S rRNA (adenine1518-N6/adenine1519-N6)-dimethyltransferase